MTETSMMDSASSSGRSGAWHQSVAAKLLLAFGLIVALTLAATLLSLIRFNSFDSVLHRLTDVSLPVVRVSLSMDSNATEVAATATNLGGIKDGVKLFEQYEALTERIQDLWTGLTALQNATGETSATRHLQFVIAGIDRQVGELHRAAGDRNTIFHRRKGLLAEVSKAAQAANETLGRGAPQLPSGSDFASVVRAMRTEINLAGALLEQTASIHESPDLQSLKRQYERVSEHVADDLMTVAARTFDWPGLERLRATLAILTAQTGDQGVFAVRARELEAEQRIDELRESLHASNAKMRKQVTQLVAEAEQESSADRARTAQTVARSKFWMIVIAIASLVLAGLIVWLFVLRYVAARLHQLARSMLAIASGHLDAPLPESRPDELGDMSRALVVFRNNAREIRAAKEEAEKARSEAEAASRTKSSFLANMSHELRTPLNAIIGYSEILVEDATDRSDDAGVADLQKIQAAGKHLLGLINDILDLSKIEAGRMDVYLEQVFVAKLIDEVKTIVEPMVTKNGNRLMIECPADVGTLRTDMTKLKQSLINLLSNSAKFTKQGEVGLKVSRIEDEGSVSRVRFAIFDSGIGMTDEQLGRLFQAFTQADSSTTRNFGGTGLGLTITKHFCTMLGGDISVTSEAGKGSTFTIELPDQAIRAAPAAAAESRMVRGDVPIDAMTVLIVDDDPAVHEVLSATLSKEGYRLVHAHDGGEALDLMRKSPPNVVTLDVMMPKIDGWSVLGMMKSEPALQHIPVIMLTIVDDRNLGYSLGASEFMTKPIDRARLVALIRRLAHVHDDAVVLIVDDDPDVRSFVRKTVEGVGLNVAEAVNGRAALNWLQRNAAPALILLDLMMPGMDGFEFLEWMRESAQLSDIPVVVLTAKALTEDERIFLAERTTLVLSKKAQPIGGLGQALAAIVERASVKFEQAANG